MALDWCARIDSRKCFRATEWLRRNFAMSCTYFPFIPLSNFLVRLLHFCWFDWLFVFLFCLLFCLQCRWRIKVLLTNTRKLKLFICLRWVLLPLGLASPPTLKKQWLTSEIGMNDFLATLDCILVKITYKHRARAYQHSYSSFHTCIHSLTRICAHNED